MLAPTPMLRPSPMDLAGLFAGTLSAFRQRFGLLILIVVPPTVLTVAVIILGGLGSSAAISAAAVDPQSLRGSLIGLLTAAFAATIAIVVATVKAQGMTAVAAYEIAQGERPTFAGLWKHSSGFLARMAPVLALVFAALLILWGLIAGLVVAIVVALAGRSMSRAVGLLSLAIVLMNLAAPLVWWLRVKLLYTVPVVAIEERGGIAAMKRSWTLTRGGFWRTLGYYVAASFAIGTVVSPLVIFGQLPLVAIRYPHNVEHPGDLWAPMVAAMPLLMIAVIVPVLAQLVTEPAIQTYTAYMYIDQVRRSELPPAPVGPPPGYRAPGPYWGAPGPAYFPQPSPGPAYPAQPNPGPVGPGPSFPPPRQSGAWQPPA